MHLTSHDDSLIDRSSTYGDYQFVVAQRYIYQTISQYLCLDSLHHHHHPLWSWSSGVSTTEFAVKKSYKKTVTGAQWSWNNGQSRTLNCKRWSTFPLFDRGKSDRLVAVKWSRFAINTGLRVKFWVVLCPVVCLTRGYLVIEIAPPCNYLVQHRRSKKGTTTKEFVSGVRF